MQGPKTHLLWFVRSWGPTLIRPAWRGLGSPAQGCRRHGSNKQTRDVPLGNQRITQGKQGHDRCWSDTGLESPFSDTALNCQPKLTETETERKRPSVNAMSEQNWPAHDSLVTAEGVKWWVLL